MTLTLIEFVSREFSPVPFGPGPNEPERYIRARNFRPGRKNGNILSACINGGPGRAPGRREGGRQPGR